MKSEDKVQGCAFQFFWNNWPEYRGALFHNCNTPRNKIDGSRLIAMGLIKGTPDLTLAIPRGGYGALYIEVKRKGGKPSLEQLEQHIKLREFGNKVIICDNPYDIIIEICKYLGIDLLTKDVDNLIKIKEEYE